ncbi:MAG: hypothetical protein GY801_31155 [bacterium]|nr:hypothetical protein [bacterium]
MEEQITIAVIGDFESQRASHIATNEALQHAADVVASSIDIQWLATQVMEDDFEKQGLENFDGIWGAPGVPESSPGAIATIRFAREKGVPYVGT